MEDDGNNEGMSGGMSCQEFKQIQLSMQAGIWLAHDQKCTE
jgi:hypothetical protein